MLLRICSNQTKDKCNSLSTISSLRSINYSVNVHTFTSVISVLFNSCKWVFILTHFDKTHLQSSSQSYLKLSPSIHNTQTEMLTLRATFKIPKFHLGVGTINFAFVSWLIIFGFLLDAYFPKLKGSSSLELTRNSAFQLTVPHKIRNTTNAGKTTWKYAHH